MPHSNSIKSPHLFISPHLDDVVLSCGGFAYRLAKSGERVIILTLITGDAPESAPVTFETWRHKIVWDLGEKPFKERCKEDVKSVQVLGAEYAHLGLLDGIYRFDATGQPHYPRNTVGVPVVPADRIAFSQLVEDALENYLNGLGKRPVHVYCPLTLGWHVDHVIIRDVVERLWKGPEIIYYEDYPYAQKLSNDRLEKFAKSDGANWSSFTVQLTPEEIEARIASIACHASQIPDLFMTIFQRWGEIAERRVPFASQFLVKKLDPAGANQRMASAIRSYVERVGGERYWQRLEHNEKN